MVENWEPQFPNKICYSGTSPFSDTFKMGVNQELGSNTRQCGPKVGGSRSKEDRKNAKMTEKKWWRKMYDELGCWWQKKRNQRWWSSYITFASFTHRHVYTETITYRNFYTQKHVYTEELLHTDFFTQRSLCTGNVYIQKLYTENCLHVYTQRCFHTQMFLHTEAFTQGSLYT